MHGLHSVGASAITTASQHALQWSVVSGNEVDVTSCTRRTKLPKLRGKGGSNQSSITGPERLVGDHHVLQVQLARKHRFVEPWPPVVKGVRNMPVFPAGAKHWVFDQTCGGTVQHACTVHIAGTVHAMQPSALSVWPGYSDRQVALLLLPPIYPQRQIDSAAATTTTTTTTSIRCL